MDLKLKKLASSANIWVQRNLSLKAITILMLLTLMLLIKLNLDSSQLVKTEETCKEFEGRVVDWQEITEIGSHSDNITQKTKFFVYSAYFDYYEGENVLRVVAVTPSFSQQTLFCHVFDKSLNLLGMSPATLRTTKCPQNSLMYSAAFILCKLDSALIGEMQQQDMKFVSIYPYSSLSDNILRDPDGKLSNILKINVPPPEEIEEPHQFSLCVQPTFSYNNVFEFVQWLEFHKMMGVSHFSFYNMSIGPTVSCVMKSMAVNQDTPIHVLQWTTPSPDHLILHVNGQIAQGNDCAFRYRGVSKYVVFVDFDECIIPNYVYARNYDELIEVLDEKWKNTFGRNRTVAQYQFRGGFFGWDFGKFPSSTFKNNTNSGQIELEDLEIYKHVIRQKGLLSYKHRSKLITIPRRIIEPGVHSIDEAVDDGVEFEVPHKVAYLHHYRQYGCGRNCTFTPQETDFVGHFFALTLLQNVRHMISKLTQECDLKSVKEWRRDNNHVR